LTGKERDTNYQGIVLKRIAIGVVNDVARPKEVLDIFSGDGFIDLKNAIQKQLMENTELKDHGILVTNVTVYNVDLDEKYEAEIAAKQLAIQSALRKTEEEKAARKEAEKVKAEVQATIEKRTGEAEAKKIEVTKAAEAQKQQTVLEAEAAKQRVVLAAEAEKEQLRNKGEGDKLMQVAQAEGARALGLAQAEVEKAKRDAMYEGIAGERRATVEIARAQAEKLMGLLSGVKVIPENAYVALMDENAKSPGLVLPVATTNPSK
jgi:hypothetical protein